MLPSIKKPLRNMIFKEEKLIFFLRISYSFLSIASKKYFYIYSNDCFFFYKEIQKALKNQLKK
ncbi:MAG: hypothetical protein PG977_000290 [Bartonella clarridgeiae]|nr:MAG: hypothetical protein PG977_000290 [Bartonella clarridgeiae]